MMIKIRKSSIFILIVFVVFFTYNSYSQNFLTNGDFESGGSGSGFLVTSPYSLATTPGTSSPGNYSFVTNPQLLNSTFNAGGDHTTGSGRMMVIDGSNVGGLNFLWTSGNTGGAIPGFVIGQSYIFSYWIKSVSNLVTNPATQADIVFFSPDVTSIVPSTLNSLAPLPAQSWQKVSYTFTANDVNILIRLSNNNNSAVGNDFAIDDMSIVCASPPNLVITNPPTVCSPLTVNLTLAAVTAGSDSGNLSYWINADTTLPLSSANAITTSGTYYIKNTVSGCETIRPVVVTIANKPSPPTVSTPTNFCISKPASLLTAIPSSGLTLNWYGTAVVGGTASTTAPTPTLAGTYYVSQTNAVCESNRAPIVVSFIADNGTVISSFICDSNKILPADKNSSVYFDWNQPSTISNRFNYTYTIAGGSPVTGYIPGTGTNLQVFGMIPGQSATITITSESNPCTVATKTCTVPCPLPLLKPNFLFTKTTFCVGNAMPSLSDTSPAPNFLKGKWNPATISNAVGVVKYTFTPDNPCAESQELIITVNPIPILAPTFLSLPTPTLTVCQNSTGQVLPTSSNDAIPITGNWGPFTSINTTIIGTIPYTFIPTAGQCVSSTPTTINVTVNSIETPTFNTIPAICAGTTLVPLLPTDSTNFSQISGVWNPDKIDNTTTKEYEFTPIIASHPCAPKTKITITVTPNITPTFNVSNIQCEGTAIITLPTNSSDFPQISGSWNPATIDTSVLGSNSYVFTPNVGSCVVSATFPKTIEVYTSATPTFTPITPFCAGTPIPSLPNSNEGIPGIWNPDEISGNVGTNNYQFTPDISCSPTPPPLAVTVLASPTPTFSPLVPNDVCEGSLFALPDFSNDIPAITGSWETPTGPVTSIDTSVAGTDIYTFILDAGQCATAPAPINITVNPSNTLTSVGYTVTNAFEDNQIITVLATAAGNYLYQLDSGPLQTSPVFENVSFGIHTVTVSDANGCSASITEPDILVIQHPKFFTPNGDGFNDTWKLSDLNSILITKIYIFDRYGKLLKEIAANGTGWDGTYLGVPVPADDYWFTVDYIEDFLPKEFKSHFSLKR